MDSLPEKRKGFDLKNQRINPWAAGFQGIALFFPTPSQNPWLESLISSFCTNFLGHGHGLIRSLCNWNFNISLRCINTWKLVGCLKDIEVRLKASIVITHKEDQVAIAIYTEPSKTSNSWSLSEMDQSMHTWEKSNTLATMGFQQLDVISQTIIVSRFSIVYIYTLLYCSILFYVIKYDIRLYYIIILTLDQVKNYIISYYLTLYCI